MMTNRIKKKPQKKTKSVLIKNYGLFWEHDKINWSKKRCLIGYSSKKKECCFDGQIGIYVLYNENKDILYVGQAGNGNATLLSRLKRHNSDHLEGWWTYFSWFGLIDLNKNGELSKFSKEKFHANKAKMLDSLEGIMIAAINPKMNKQGEKLGTRFKLSKQSVSDELEAIKKGIKDIKDILKNTKGK